MFEQALLAGPRDATRGATFALSMGAQILFLATAITVPLFLIEGPSVVRLNTLLMAPPPPPPPPFMKLVEVPARVLQRLSDGHRIFTPSRIPPKVANIVEPDLPQAVDLYSREQTGVPGGLPGSGGIPGGFSQANLGPPPPAAEPVKPKQAAAAAEPTVQRIQRGGDVQAAKLINRVVPPYPPLAKAARIQGTVRLMGIIGRDGRIMQLQVLSGHPLLAGAAVDAVRQWVYQPTLLNGQPVEVVAPIDVHFTLGN